MQGIRIDFRHRLHNHERCFVVGFVKTKTVLVDAKLFFLLHNCTRPIILRNLFVVKIGILAGA